MGKLVVFALSALGMGMMLPQDAQEPPAVPIDKEPHHHLVMENAYLKAYEIEVGPRQATSRHQHDYDNLFVCLGAAEVTNDVTGKPEVKLKLPDLAVQFSRKPYSHVIANDGDAPFRNVTVELLHSQGELKEHFPSLSAALAATPSSGETPREALVLRTDEMRLVAVDIAPGSAWSVPHDGCHRLIVITDRVRDSTRPREKNSPFPEGMLVWVSADATWTVSNTTADEMKLMVLVFAERSAK